MTNENKSHLFQKGHPGGPGRPPATPEEKKLTRLTRDRFNRIVRKYLNFTIEELKDIYANKKTHALDLMIIATMVKAIEGGNEKKMNWFLEQLFGKLPDYNVNINGEEEDISHKSIMKRIAKDKATAKAARAEKSND